MSTSADRKEEDSMSETTITATRATTGPDYARTAGTLLEACRMFYRMPENEEAYQKWKGGRKSENDLGSGDLIHRG